MICFMKVRAGVHGAQGMNSYHLNDLLIPEVNLCGFKHVDKT